MPQSLTVASLIAFREKQQRRKELARSIMVHDLALTDLPERSMMFEPDRVNPTVVVRTTGYAPFFIERIELLHSDADARLRRYELVEENSGPTQATGGGAENC